MCVSVLLNANPVLFILGSYLFKVQASAADAMGKALSHLTLSENYMYKTQNDANETLFQIISGKMISTLLT